VAFYLMHVGKARGEAAHPGASVLSQLLMMSNVLSGQNLPNVVWSLSYEMVFYLLLTALFLARVHKRSNWYAVGFAVAAVAIGGVLPQAYLIHHVAPTRVIALVADLLILAGLAFAVVRRGMSRLLGAALAAVVALTLVAFNGSWLQPFEALSILALMFTGTVFYRAEQGQYSWRKAITIGLTVLGLALAAGLWHSRALGMSAHAELIYSRKWVSALGLAGLTFAAGMTFRNVRWPRALTYHFYPSRQHPFWLQVLIAVGLLTAMIVLSSVTYLCIERPMQNLGRRVGRWLDARYGPDRAPGMVPVDRQPALAGRHRAG
jgi:peptidoglycan/LPS O-acetylase OafA/YrhL